MTQDFVQKINQGYAGKGESIFLGAAMLNGEAIAQAKVALPLRMLNRHGLIAGATGTGKTVTLQMLAESVSKKGVPVLLMDLKGDLSGIATAGLANERIQERCKSLETIFTPQGNPVEFLSLSTEPGTRLRATITEFGPVLLSKALGLNETQGGIVSILFKYADDHHLPLLDIRDFKQLLQHTSVEGKKQIQSEYGNVNPASLSTILRKLIELESQGAEQFFGEKSFEVEDLLRQDAEGRGIISVVRLADMQDKPRLFSTFMLSLLAEIYQAFPEAGDQPKPKLVIFFDEAHLIFSDAPKALLEQIENMVKLIRSKGVGLFFVTQNPNDIPDSVLSQLGLKVQHALRAFTEKDRKSIKKVAENYPVSEFYKTDQVLTSLGIGQALITALSESGSPTPLAVTLLAPPSSRIGTLNKQELDSLIDNSKIREKYRESIDRESAYEILKGKLREENEPEANEPTKTSKKPEQSTLEKVVNSSVGRQIGRTLTQELTRGLLGVLGLGQNSRRSRKSWF